MYGYIYKTTNLISKKIYIGQKKSDKFLGNKYLGSGVKLLDAVKSYGKENFKVELIEEIDKLEDMDTREIYWIKYYNATNSKIGYNLSEGGKVNRNLVGENNPFYHKHHTEETRNKLKELGKKRYHSLLSDETKLKISIFCKGRIVSEETRQKLSENAKTNPNYGLKGKHLSEEHRKKVSLAKKGKTSKAKGKIHITNDKEDKMIFPEQLDEYMNNGWRRGRKKFSDEACKNISSGHKNKPTTNGRIWVTDGKINKVIPPNELQHYLELGYKRGITRD